MQPDLSSRQSSRDQPVNSREQLMEAILERAATDRGFRAGLLEEPKETVHRAFGIHVPTEYQIRFIERDPELDSLVVLPDFREACAELSDDDLENVCGGTGGDWNW